jgi:hypothetical protein
MDTNGLPKKWSEGENIGTAYPFHQFNIRQAKLVIASQKIYEAKVAALTVHVLTFMLQQHIGARAPVR